MSRAITVFVLVAALALLGSSRPAPRDDNDAPEEQFPTVIPPDNGVYFSTTVGAKWVYEVTYEKMRSMNGIHTYVVTKVEEKDGAKLVTRGRLKRNGDVAELVTWKVAADGLYAVESQLFKMDEPQLELKLPHKEGNRWKLYEKQPDYAAYTAHGPEEVNVPAGTFKAIRVVTHTGQSDQTMWYAPGVGLVKSEKYDHWPPEKPVGKSKVVLKAFRPGKE